MHLLKPDGTAQPERGSAGDTIGAAVFWAAGYHTPCNRVVFLSPDDLVLAPDAEVRRTDGYRGPLNRETVDEILAMAHEREDGLLRFGGPFLAGDKFTAVDAFFAPVAFRIQTYNPPVEERARAYAARLLGLPAMQDWSAAALAEDYRDPPHDAENEAVGTITADFRAPVKS